LMLAARIMQHIPERANQLTSSRNHFTQRTQRVTYFARYNDFHHYLCCRARNFRCCDGACHMGSGYLKMAYMSHALVKEWGPFHWKWTEHLMAALQ
jgi:hypothetical protein